jgi:hypothetical protein
MAKRKTRKTPKAPAPRPNPSNVNINDPVLFAKLRAAADRRGYDMLTMRAIMRIVVDEWLKAQETVAAAPDAPA